MPSENSYASWENIKIKTQASHTLSWITRAAPWSKWLIALLLLLQSVQGVFGVAYALCLRSIINHAVDKELHAFVWAVAFFVGLLILQVIVSSLFRYLNDFTLATVANGLKGRLFSGLLSGDYGNVTRIHSAEWMNLLTSDVDVVAEGAVTIVPGFIGMLVRLVGAIGALLWLEPRFLYVLIPGGILLLLSTHFFRKILQKLHKQMQEAEGRVRVFMQERLESLITVHAFGQENASAGHASTLMNEHKRFRMKRSNFSNICNIGFSGVMDGAYVMGVAYCGYGLLNGTMSYGNLMAVLQLIGQVQNPFANITGYLPKYYAMLASAERLRDIEAFKQMQPVTFAEQDAGIFYRNSMRALVLENVRFSYLVSDQHNQENLLRPVVLENINLTIRKGEFLAITGPSGSGKSTFLKLLMCLYDMESGERFIQTVEGQVALTGAYRSLFAYVPQGNQLMAGTLRNIIAFGNEERMKDSKAMHEALRIACADEFVSALENGLDTELGERGAGLSEGQMQRIAIARAIFSKHPILLLDEATSALDEATAVKLLDNLRHLTDMTVILVTHRTNHMDLFDREIVFSDEKIIL